MTGSLFDGTAEQILVSDLDDISSQLSDKSVTDIQARLDMVLVNPSGYYRSQISAVQVTEGSYSVTDNDVVYGPWLEGIGSRNETSAFKGYQTFQIIGDRFENEVETAVNGVIDKFMEGLD